MLIKANVWSRRLWKTSTGNAADISYPCLGLRSCISAWMLQFCPLFWGFKKKEKLSLSKRRKASRWSWISPADTVVDSSLAGFKSLPKWNLLIINLWKTLTAQNLMPWSQGCFWTILLQLFHSSQIFLGWELHLSGWGRLFISTLPKLPLFYVKGIAFYIERQVNHHLGTKCSQSHPTVGSFSKLQHQQRILYSFKQSIKVCTEEPTA